MKIQEAFHDIGKTRGAAIEILDLFEEVLDRHGINIPDEDRCGEEGEACIYGSTYYELEDAITEILSEYIDE